MISEIMEAAYTAGGTTCCRYTDDWTFLHGPGESSAFHIVLSVGAPESCLGVMLTFVRSYYAFTALKRAFT